jgi:glucosamine--fructose-6-phosphate aminotransferase (isomerizing)
MTTALGVHFAAEIAEQPALWRALAARPGRGVLHDAGARGPALLIGSGSSAFVADIAARMLRRAGRAALAMTATDLAFDAPPFAPSTLVAFSQSGRSADVLAAVAGVADARRIAVTNDPSSPLAAWADDLVDLQIGPERAVPATKSVTAMTALAYLAAAADADAARRALRAAADAVAAWLERAAADLAPAVAALCNARSIIIAGSGDGIPAAREVALKCKEATYRHAEAVAAGEFRHGGVAMLDASCVVLVLDEPADPAQAKVTAAATRAGAVTIVLGCGGVGPRVPAACAVLGWIVTGQCLALELGRTLGIDGDAPRGIGKVVG